MPWWKHLSLEASLIRMLACIMYLEAYHLGTKPGVGVSWGRAWFDDLLIERPRTSILGQHLRSRYGIISRLTALNPKQPLKLCLLYATRDTSVRGKFFPRSSITPLLVTRDLIVPLPDHAKE